MTFSSKHQRYTRRGIYRFENVDAAPSAIPPIAALSNGPVASTPNGHGAAVTLRVPSTPGLSALPGGGSVVATTMVEYCDASMYVSFLKASGVATHPVLDTGFYY